MSKEIRITSAKNVAEPISEDQKSNMIEEATEHYGRFLDALGFDWKNDPHMQKTPFRVAKAWVHDLVKGCYMVEDDLNITAFPNDEGYTGMIIQSNVPVTSMCAHHNLAFTGVAHVAYIPNKNPDIGMMIGLSKLNRIVDFYSRRPSVQETLTKQIHDHIDKVCEGNRGVAVVLEAAHTCVSCRGVKQDSGMKTSQLSGYFFTNEVGTRTEFFNLIK